jgi:hypothetical protein
MKVRSLGGRADRPLATNQGHQRRVEEGMENSKKGLCSSSTGNDGH